MSLLRSVACLLIVPFLVAAEQRWIKVTSSNFELFTTSGEKRAREAILHFEQVHAFFSKATGLRPSTKGRVRIVAFNSEKEFRPYRLGSDSPAFAGGDLNRDEIAMAGISSENYPIAIHEYVHVLLRRFNKLPLWLNEGLADLYSSLRPEGKKVRFGDVLPDRAIALQATKWLAIGDLCAVAPDSPYYTDPERRHIFYAESWALAHMLILDDGYRAKLPGFMSALITGTPAPNAFRSVYGKAPDEIGKDLREYTRRSRLMVGIYDVMLSKSAEEPEIRPATQVESGLVLADLLVGVKKYAEARAAYQVLARDNPNEPAVYESLGYLEWRSGAMEAARTNFARAVDLGSRSPRLYYDYASMLDRGGEGKHQIVPMLKTALQLDPDFREARYRLGFELLREQDHKGALTQFARLKNVEPDEAFTFFHAVAYANYAVGNKEEAKRAAVRAQQFANDESMKSTVARLLEAIEQPAPREEPVSPHLVRRTIVEGKTEIVRRRSTSVEGTLVQLDCREEYGRLGVNVDRQVIRLLMQSPDKIVVTGTADGKFTFNCGAQNSQKVRIEYEPEVNAETETIGVVRAIQFK